MIVLAVLRYRTNAVSMQEEWLLLISELVICLLCSSICFVFGVSSRGFEEVRLGKISFDFRNFTFLRKLLKFLFIEEDIHREDVQNLQK